MRRFRYAKLQFSGSFPGLRIGGANGLMFCPRRPADPVLRLYGTEQFKPPVRRGPPPHPPGPQAEAEAEADAEADAEAEGDKEREGEGILARLSPGRTRFLGNTSQWVLP